MEESRHCATCKRVLLRVVSSDDHIYYKHAEIDGPADHPPMAVRDSEDPVTLDYKCDFCLDSGIAYTMVIDGDLTIAEIGVVYDPEWGMCQTCSELAMNDNWALLTNRAFMGFERHVGPMSRTAREIMTRTYAELRSRLVMYYEEPKNDGGSAGWGYV